MRGFAAPWGLAGCGICERDGAAETDLAFYSAPAAKEHLEDDHGMAVSADILDSFFQSTPASADDAVAEAETDHEYMAEEEESSESDSSDSDDDEDISDYGVIAAKRSEDWKNECTFWCRHCARVTANSWEEMSKHVRDMHPEERDSR